MAKAYKALPPASELWERFDYKPLTGELVRKTTGKSAGHLNAKGYMALGFKKGIYYQHRIVWKWVTGADPKKTVDHRDTNRSNNAWNNLRLAQHIENCWNRDSQDVEKCNSRWRARVMHEGQRYNLGMWDTEQEARAACIGAQQVLRGSFCPLR